LLQITITTRSRRITLQCSQRGLTDARTFTGNSSRYIVRIRLARATLLAA